MAAWEGKEEGTQREKDLGTGLEEETHSLSQVVCHVGTSIPPGPLNHLPPLRWKKKCWQLVRSNKNLLAVHVGAHSSMS